MSRSTASMRRWSTALVAAGVLSQATTMFAQATQKIDQE